MDPASTPAFASASVHTRSFLRSMLFLLLSCGPSLAAPVSSGYTCLADHETAATAKMQSLATELIVKFFKRRKIGINNATAQISASFTLQTDANGEPCAAFTGKSAGAGSATSAAAGTITAKGGTKFNVLFSSGSDNQTSGEYRIISSQSGFDREGNALNRHCRLDLFLSDDGDGSKTLLVVNATSGHVMGLVPLPRRIDLY